MCPPTSFSDHRISASRKICSVPQKDFFDSIGHSRRDWLRATIGPRPLRPESGSEIRHALTTQTSADAESTTELGASAATGAENQAGNEKRARRGMKPTVESQIYEFQFWGTYITRKFGKLLPMVDTHRNS
jgi:hypothetical protein